MLRRPRRSCRKGHVDISPKKERVVELLRKMYGYQYIPHYIGSPYEKHPLDDAELVLHELAHQSLMPASSDYVFAPGYMKDAMDVVGNYIHGLPLWKQDLNEIRALAIEFDVSKRLGLGLDQHIIALNAAINTWHFKKESDFGRLVLAIRRAKGTFTVQFHADTIVESLNLLEEGKL